MKARVLSDFIDKETNELKTTGSVIEISEKRFKEIQGKGHFLEKEKASEPDEPQEKEKASEPAESSKE